MRTSLTKNVKNHSVTSEATLTQVAEMIKYGIDDIHISNQKKLRSLPKNQQSKFKEQNFTCYTPHGCFDYVKISALKELSGIIYIDIDNVSNLAQTKQELANNPFVHAVYSSVRGNGLGIWVKVKTEGLTSNQYRTNNSVINQVADFLNIKIDDDAKGIARLNIIPHDPDIHYCSNSLVFTPKFLKEEKKTTKKEVRDYLHGDSSSRYLTQTLLNDYNNQDYVVIPQGKGYMDTFIVNRTIPEGRRNSTLRAIAVANIFNNPEKSERDHLARLVNINNEYCKSPLTYKEVVDIHNAIYKQHIEGTLIFKVKNKYVWFNPKSSLTTKEKLSISAVQGGKIKSDRTKTLIKEAIAHLYSEEIIISQKLIAEFTKKSDRTIRKYWPEFKSEITEINNLLKGNQNGKITNKIQLEESGVDNNSHGNAVQPTKGNEIYKPRKSSGLQSAQDLSVNNERTETSGDGIYDCGIIAELGETGGKTESQQLDITKNIERINMNPKEPKLSVPLFSQKKYMDLVKEMEPDDLIELTEFGKTVQTISAKLFIKNKEELIPLPF